jgi:hypothetical protein
MGRNRVGQQRISCAAITGKFSSRNVVNNEYYFSWTYSLDGKLTKATKLKGIKDFSPKDFGLIEFPVTEWETFVFVHMGPSMLLEFPRS